MLNCWQADAKSRFCFSEIVTELDQLINCDGGYFVLKNEGVSNANGYVTVSSTKAPDNHYNTHEANPTTTPGDHHVDATDTSNADVAATSDDQTMTTDAEFTTPHDEYVNPTITHDDYINPGITSDNYINPGTKSDDYINSGIISNDYITPGIKSDGCINPITILDADTDAASDNNYVNA